MEPESAGRGSFMAYMGFMEKHCLQIFNVNCTQTQTGLFFKMCLQFGTPYKKVHFVTFASETKNNPFFEECLLRIGISLLNWRVFDC